MSRNWFATFVAAVVLLTLLALVVPRISSSPSRGEAATVSCLSLLLDDIHRAGPHDTDPRFGNGAPESLPRDCVKDGSVLRGNHHPTKAGITPPPAGAMRSERR